MDNTFEETIDISKDHFARVQKLIHLGSWKVELENMTVEATQEARNIYGFGGEKLTLELIQTVPLAEYREALDLALKNLIAGVSSYDVEFPIKRVNDGEYRIIHSIAEYDPFKKCITGTFQDITKRKNAESKVEALLKEKDLILREVHHRIKNNMASIESLLKLQIESSGNSEVKTELKDAVTRLSSMRVLYEKLYQSKDFMETSSLAYLSRLIDDIAEVFPESEHITISKELDDFIIPSDITFSLGIIINELLTNALKYAFSTNSGNNFILVSARKIGSEVSIMVRDNGAGYAHPGAMDQSNGFGMKLIRMLSEQIGGRAEFSNNNGAVCSVEFLV